MVDTCLISHQPFYAWWTIFMSDVNTQKKYLQFRELYGLFQIFVRTKIYSTNHWIMWVFVLKFSKWSIIGVNWQISRKRLLQSKKKEKTYDAMLIHSFISRSMDLPDLARSLLISCFSFREWFLSWPTYVTYIEKEIVELKTLNFWCFFC